VNCDICDEPARGKRRDFGVAVCRECFDENLIEQDRRKRLQRPALSLKALAAVFRAQPVRMRDPVDVE
jgi:hypothetical protein